MNKIFAICCAFLLFQAGCYLGDRAATTQMVSLNFPVPEGQTKASFSVNDSEVQEALKLIDSVLVSAGFVRESIPPVANQQDPVATYSKYKGTGPRPVGGPRVYFRDDRLDVVLVEGGNRNAPVSTATKEICNSLQRELSSRYGAKRVRVER
ncbi:hypothetical protein Cflav_PD5952 [Pedosphaera parvula Ellin514]|uniref:Lipoprotein n=1 Tax=Pedosphaera parvula (strain Ellin514) TaxID=320771 RepID=B9X9X6_PEDPL|nr:hypothetical protein Cflav_PD5952 [Pedosphaera parvula Ellin514]